MWAELRRADYEKRDCRDCPERKGDERCPECFVGKLEAAKEASPAWAVLERASLLILAVDAGLSVGLADVRFEDLRAMAIVREEREAYKNDLIEDERRKAEQCQGRTKSIS